jgi:NTP pyrophosphatase (non-canonical NTP hydrolase)
MQFKELQEKILEVEMSYGEKYGITIDEEYALLKLYEEMGELSQAVLISRKKCRPEKYPGDAVAKEKLAEEMADVLGLLITNAKLLGVDLDAAIEKKWLSRAGQIRE